MRPGLKLGLDPRLGPELDREPVPELDRPSYNDTQLHTYKHTVFRGYENVVKVVHCVVVVKLQHFHQSCKSVGCCNKPEWHPN